ncbi:circularly permuted type 2 ATP-grasp protein [Azohydromonas caseinilytica]|uniref:Circularly permuted type 2 ATP-grasp protein n=1 Tax=Azohydromonas caseinilytica TaxID=2728836 RepID=A0A848FDH5_9BURK|nr:circularly permuted type 2 ATP-grasp protein [Azohydromonas caseinilytica]NML17504.1 circularly permuted type 2 ATP-grasp protein [Azohydromonas caseinilytica]
MSAVTPHSRPRAAASAADWLARLPPTGTLDEWRAPDRSLSPSWQRFLATLPARPQAFSAELQRRAQQLAQQLRTDATTHNVHGTEQSLSWTPELLPLVMEPADWAAIERGVAQRAQLLQLILADAYGEQRLLQRALLPPALLFRHPGYLRPLHGFTPPGGQFLHVVAFELARGPDGRWWVTAQRTRGPAGLGHVLQHRLIVSRLFPEAYEQLRVQHMASSFRRLLQSLRAQAALAAGDAHPRLALLTPGPDAPGYFEHAYLARYLGLPLVEGGDLTVRGERLYLKMLEGLAPVHGLLRLIDDAQCDPLEQEEHAGDQGVPGLLQVLRAGRLALANAPGSGFLESPALSGFLPGIAQALLGQPLLLPTLASWWCGEAAAWQGVQPHLPKLCMRPSFGPDGGALRPDAGRIQEDPEAWTLQEHPGRSRALRWREGRLEAVPVGLRVYAVADGAGHWQVLPSGLARVTGEADAPLLPGGGSALDLWVRTDGTVDTFSMLTRRLGVDDILARRGPVASRTAESLYWLGRYTERAEQAVRLARAALRRTQEGEPSPPVLRALRALLQRAGLLGAQAPAGARTSLQRALVKALAEDNGVGAQLAALSRSAGSLRERLSPEQWGLMRRMGRDLHAALLPQGRAAPGAAEVLRALDAVAVQLAAVTGAQSDRMTRDFGWRLLAVGRHLERLVSHATQFGVLLREGALGQPEGNALLLELYDSTITFRARYQQHQDLIALVDLLVLDDNNPRAWACVLRRLRTELRKLPIAPEVADELLAGLPAQGPGLTLQAISGLDDEALRQSLAALSTQLAAAGAQLSDDIGKRFFAHVSDPLQTHEPA